MGCVYKMTNRINGMIYIGMTTFRIEKRLREHQQLSRYSKIIFELHKAIREFGFESFDIETLFISDNVEELNKCERDFILKFNTNITTGGIGYNMTSGGQGTTGFKWSQESKNKKIKHCPVSKEQLQNDNENLQLQEIADKYNASRSVVQGWFKNFGLLKETIQLNYNNQNLNAWSEEECNKAILLYQNKFSNKQIAEKLGRTETAVMVKLIRLRKALNISSMRYK